MTVRERIRGAARNDAPVLLNEDEVKAVNAAIEWGERILESLNAEGADTDGGNTETSGLDEDYT